MRSDPKHTANTYLDSDRLFLSGCINKRLVVDCLCVVISIVGVVEERLEVSEGVAVEEDFGLEKTANADSERLSMTQDVSECHENQKQWSRGDRTRADSGFSVPEGRFRTAARNTARSPRRFIVVAVGQAMAIAADHVRLTIMLLVESASEGGGS